MESPMPEEPSSNAEPHTKFLDQVFGSDTDIERRKLPSPNPAFEIPSVRPAHHAYEIFPNLAGVMLSAFFVLLNASLCFAHILLSQTLRLTLPISCFLLPRMVRSPWVPDQEVHCDCDGRAPQGRARVQETDHFRSISQMAWEHNHPNDERHDGQPRKHQEAHFTLYLRTLGTRMPQAY